MANKIIINNSFLTTSICISFPFGSRDDPKEYSGLAHLLEHMLMASPININGENIDICGAVEKTGGTCNAETGLESLVIYAQVLPEYAEIVIERIFTGLFKPNFTNNILNVEIENIRQELEVARADPSDRVQDSILENIFSGSSISRPVGGYYSSLKNVDINILKNHYLKMIKRGADIVVAAPQEISISIPNAAQECISWNYEDTFFIDEKENSSNKKRNEEAFTWICLGAAISRREYAESTAEVLSYMLGGGPSSLLYEELRVKNSLSYSFESWSRAYSSCHLWRTLIGAEPKNLAEIKILLLNIFKKISDSDSEDILNSLEHAKLQAKMSVVKELQDPLSLAKTISIRRIKKLENNYEKRLQNIQDVTISDIAKLSEEILKKHRVSEEF